MIILDNNESIHEINEVSIIMGEIKSTIDIIMEKTKGMTLSDDEKKEIKEKEIADKLRGLANRILDGMITFEMLESELMKFDKRDADTVSKEMIKIVFPLIVPGQDNSIKIDILELVKGIDTALVKQRIKETEKKLENKRTEFAKEMDQAIKEKDVSGSAVIPNINAYPGFIRYQQDLKNELQQELLNLSGHAQ